MLISLLSPVSSTRTLGFSLTSLRRYRIPTETFSLSKSDYYSYPIRNNFYISKCNNRSMASEKLNSTDGRRHPVIRSRNVSGYLTDVIEFVAEDPKMHVVFIPGNPGIASFYIDFVERLHELLGETASITAVGHISHAQKDLEGGRLFSMEDQINHKVDFIRHELQNIEVPIVLVGHSIGSYISIEMFKRAPEKVIYCIGLYPFLAVNTKSSTQSAIRRLAMSPVLSAIVSSLVGFLGLLPKKFSKFLVKLSLGKSWPATSVEALCTNLFQYHAMRNVLYMAMTEFKKLSETPDWAFMKQKQTQLAFLFGMNDHWGPLEMFDEISKNVPDADLAVEREGHTHAFCCSEAGSLWVAQHVASLIRKQKIYSS